MPLAITVSEDRRRFTVHDEVPVAVVGVAVMHAAQGFPARCGDISAVACVGVIQFDDGVIIFVANVFSHVSLSFL